MNFETLEFNKDGAIGVLTLNRPAALNALNAQVLKELDRFLDQIQKEQDVRVLIVTGSGEKAFVAGADIKEIESVTPAEAKAFASFGQSVFQKIEDLAIPTIAAVNGFALGGGLELALACDFIIASSNAKLGLPEVSLGLLPGYGGTQRLARHCGKNIARLFVLTGDMFSAEQCLQFGLVAQVTDQQNLMSQCKSRAESIAKRSPFAIRLAKEAIASGFDLSQKDGMNLEAQLFQKVFLSKDKVEGVKAFVEKRPPQFTGE